LSKPLPRLTLLWLNFNSIHNIGLICESMDYPDFEVLLLDNASTDGSYEAFTAHLRGKATVGRPQVRLIRTPKNLGYTGGFDFGYAARDPASTYVAVVSDDAILMGDYARQLVGEMEKDPRIGGIQGIVSTLDGKKVDSAGVLVDRFMIPHHIKRGETVGTPTPH